MRGLACGIAGFAARTHGWSVRWAVLWAVVAIQLALTPLDWRLRRRLAQQ